MTGTCVVLAGVLLGCPEPPGDHTHPAVTWTAARTEDDVRRPDPWLGEDKAQHFVMSFAATAFAYAGARFALDREPARFAAAGTALAAGLGKEIHDARTGEFFSIRDMVWNVAGVAIGVTVVRAIR